MVSFPSVYALVPYSPIFLSDYIDDVGTEGENKVVRYYLPVTNYSAIYANTFDGNVIRDYVSDMSLGWSASSDYVSIMVYTWPFGQMTGDWGLSASDVVLYIGDIIPGSSFDLSYEVDFDTGINLSNATSCMFYVYFYDANGNHIRRVSSTSTIGSTGNDNRLVFSSTVTVPSDAVYLSCRSAIRVPNVSAGQNFTISTRSLSVVTSSSIYYEDSQTLKAINAALEEQNDLLRQIFSKLTEFYDWSVQSLMGALNSIRTVVSSGFSSIGSWLSTVNDNIVALPDRIAEALQGLFVPSAESMQEMGSKTEEMVSDRFGAVYEGAQIIDQWAGQLQVQAAEPTLTVPSVTVNLAGVPFTFGGWEVDVVPDGFEFLVETCKIVIDIIATMAFLNGIKSRFERTLEG